MSESLLARKIREVGGYAELVDLLGADRVLKLTKNWEAIARPEQLPPPGDWATWLVLAGRGWGKTASGAHFSVSEISSGRCGRFALVGPTASDVRDVMVEGQSGVMSIYAGRPNDDCPTYEPSKRRITWPNGAIATTYSAEEPDRLRGPQHDGFWADELAAWKLPRATWEQLQFGLRLGNHPRGVVTTTPRPIPLVRELLKEAVITRGTTYENAVNLAPGFLKAIVARFGGTRLGRQEIGAEILDDNPGALWKLSNIEETRRLNAPAEFRRMAGAIDPAVTSREDSDESGIIFGGIADCMCKGFSELHAFILEDASGTYTPDQWARIVAEGYHRHGCDRIIAEINNGGEMVEATLRTLGDPNISYRGIHASRGKAIRAEPVAALYEQKRIHHIGSFPKLEDQLTTWDPLIDSYSPDRLDALVWLLTELLVSNSNYPSIFDVV